MKAIAALVAAAAIVLSGCASSPRHHVLAASSQPATTAPAAAAAPTTAAAAPADPEARICGKVSTLYPAILNAVQHGDLATIEHDAGKLTGWSRTVTVRTNDAQFANYLADAGLEISFLATPIWRTYLHKAGADLGKVIGYCKYTVGVQMGTLTSRSGK
jgi:hypothetical protein